MAANHSCESPQGVVCLPSPGEDSGDVRVEGYYEAALCVPGGVLVRPRAAEVVLGKDFVDSKLTRAHPLSLWRLHILFAHGASLSAR